jgi:hypothetical protein
MQIKGIFHLCWRDERRLLEYIKDVPERRR